MKMIIGEIAPDSGSIVIGQTVKIGYYAQEIGEEEMNPRKRVIDYIRDVAEFVETEEGKVSASKMLERFLFAGEEQYGLFRKAFRRGKKTAVSAEGIDGSAECACAG